MGTPKNKIIVVEDEALIRLDAVDALINDGFDVIEADNADAALALLHHHNGSIHVLFTDVHMPGTLSGLELAHCARRHWPLISILIVSGQTPLLRADLPARSRFLSKPYESQDILAHIREMMGIM
jgi:DNA-binding NtrC family response regulator